MLRLSLLLSVFMLWQSGAISQCTFTPVDTSGNYCSAAKFLCGSELDGYNGTLGLDSIGGNQPAIFCQGGDVENIQWFSFLVEGNDAEIIVTFSNCTGGSAFSDGFQSGIYNGCGEMGDFASLEVVCNSQSVSNGVSNLTFSTTPGIHYLYMDGFGGSVCDFTIDVVSGVCDEPFEVLNPPDADCRPSDVNNPSATEVDICVGKSQTIRPDLDIPPIISFCGVADTAFSDILNGQPFFCIETVISSPTGYTFISGEYINILYTIPTGTQISNATTIQWEEVGTYQITQNIYANPYLPSCFDFDTICTQALNVNVVPFDTIDLVPDTICQGDPYPFCGMMWTETDTLLCEDATNCEITRQPLFVQPRPVVDLGTVYSCANSCFDLLGMDYCDVGNYSISTMNFCDTLYEFTIDTFDFRIQLVGDSVITCTTPTAVLNTMVITSYTGPIIQEWRDDMGQVISIGQLSVTSPGTYTVAIIPIGYENCESIATVNITRDNDIPTLSVMTPILSCNTLSGNISASSNTTISQYIWTGPDGFLSMDPSPSVQDTGTYQLSIIASNGCLKDTTFRVVGDFAMPELDLTYQNIDCNNTMGIASFVSLDAVSQTWTFPDFSTEISPTILYSMPGVYQLSLVGTNGCIRDSTFTVLDISDDPSVQLDVDTFWRCATTSLFYPFDLVDTLVVTWTSTDGNFENNDDGILITSPGTYIAEIENTINGCTGKDTVDIVLDVDTLAIIFEVAAPVCYGDSSGQIIFADLQFGAPPFEILLNGNLSDIASLSSLPAGSYDIEVTDVFGCVVDTMGVIADPKATEITTVDNLVVKFGDDFQLEVETSIPADSIPIVEWYDFENSLVGTDNPLTITDLPQDTYGVYIEDVNGCSDSASVTVIVDFTFEVFAPTHFSPDGNSVNDIWFLKSIGIPNMIDNLSIYDRWGNKVYNKSNVAYNEESEGWNGTFNGTQCQPGVYVYVAQYRDSNGNQYTQSGDIVLVR